VRIDDDVVTIVRFSESFRLRRPLSRRSIANRNELALFYLTTGRDAAAAPLVEQLLASGETAPGADQPETLASLTELGRCYERLAGHYARQSGGKTEAETLLVRALAIKEKVRGPEHPDVARLLENLAFVYGGKDRGAEADAMHRPGVIDIDRGEIDAQAEELEQHPETDAACYTGEYRAPAQGRLPTIY
jgi:hypothetical protein